MGTLDEVAKIHFYGLIEEFKEIGLDANIDYSYLRKKWSEHSFCIVARNENDKVVGFFSVIEDQPAIYIIPEYQRLGIGGFLLSGIELFFVWVMDGNTKAENFYKKNGFKPTVSRKTTKLGHDITEIKWVKSEATE